MNQRAPRLPLTGGAYLEALVLLPLFVVILLCTLALGRAYEARLLSGQRARETAWRETASGCGQPVGTTLERAHALTRRPGIDPLSSLTTAFSGAVTLERHAGEATAHAPLLHERTSGFRTLTQLACNEPPLLTHPLRGDSAAMRGIVEQLIGRGRR